MKKLRVKKPSAKSYLLDISEWQYFTDDILPEWINNRDQYDGVIAATTIDDNLIKPLSTFLNEAHKKVPNSTLVTKGNELLNYLELDIASKFRDGQTVVVEQIQVLNRLINEFLAIYGSAHAVSESKKQSDIAGNDRKVTLQQIQNFKARYESEGKPHRGFIKAAARELGVCEATITRKL